MQDAMRIGAAAVGGYVLGRTKKAKAAVGLALWLSGRGRPRDMLRDQAVRALRSERGQELVGQLRGPVRDAGRRAAVSVLESQADRLSGSLKQRTDKLAAPAGQTARRTADKAAKPVKAQKAHKAEPDDSDESGDEEPRSESSTRRHPRQRTSA